MAQIKKEMNRTITVTVTREASVTVTIDDSIIDKEALSVIENYFDGELGDTDDWDDPEYVESSDDVKLYNYAKWAALQKLGDESEFITLDEGHTKASVNYTNLEVSFEE